MSKTRKIVFDEIVTLIFNAAIDEAHKMKHMYLTPEHVLFCTLQFHPVKGALELLQVDPLSIEKEVQEYLSHIKETTTKEHPSRSPGFEKLLECVCKHIQVEKKKEVDIVVLLYSFIDLENIQNTYFFRGRNITVKKIREIFDSRSVFDSYLKFRHEEDISDSYDNEEFLEEDMIEKRIDIELNEQMLDHFTTNLNNNIKNADPFIGQETVIHEVFQVLLRRRKNNVLLLGDAGVGKTALVREVARRIEANMVPEQLKSITILELNIVALVAGTRYRGGF